MSIVYFITHPDVDITPKIPITNWDLSDKGTQKLLVLLTQPWLRNIGAVFSSTEQKARTVAQQISISFSLKASYLDLLGEINRTSTGFLEYTEYMQVIKLFFNSPEENIKGWETARDAQERIINGVDIAIRNSPHEKDIAIISHGAVGTLLLNALQNTKIDESDLPPGQGYYFAFSSKTKQIIHSWRAIDII